MHGCWSPEADRTWAAVSCTASPASARVAICDIDGDQAEKVRIEALELGAAEASCLPKTSPRKAARNDRWAHSWKSGGAA